MSQLPPLQIYAYQSLQHLLKDWCSLREKLDPFFQSGKFLKHVHEKISNQEEQDHNLLFSLVRLMHLNPTEAEYLDTLIKLHFPQAPIQRQFLLEQLETLRSQTNKRPTSKWYFSALWNAIKLCGDPWDEEKVLAKISPPLSAGELAEAMQLLQDLKLIEKTDSGFRLAESLPEPSQEESTNEFFNEIDEFAGIAAASLPHKDRPSYSHLFPISQKGLNRIESLMESTRKELYKILDSDKGDHEVCLFHWQILPIFRFKE